MTSKVGARLSAALPHGIERFRASDRAAWLAMRRADVTASVIAALVGEHPYQTAFGLYALKTGQVADAEVEPEIGVNSISLPPMLRGTVLEPLVPKLIVMMRPAWSVEPCGFYYRDPAARIGATPDFIAIDPARKGFGSIQAKTTDAQTFRQVWLGEDGIVTPPLFIVIQAIVETVLTGAGWTEVAVLVSGQALDCHLISIPLHLGIMDRLRAEAATFWRSVETGVSPPVDYGRDSEVLSAMYPAGNGQEIDLSGATHLSALLEERNMLRSEIKIAAAKVQAIECEFKERIGPNEAGLLDGRRRVTWRTEYRGQTFTPQSERRVLRFASR